jgi:hypothetical protein
MPARLAQRSDEAQVTPRTSAQADDFAKGLKAFINETRTLARCDHPSLVRVVHLCEANATAYRVMPTPQLPTLQPRSRNPLRPPRPQRAWHSSRPRAPQAARARPAVRVRSSRCIAACKCSAASAGGQRTPNANACVRPIASTDGQRSNFDPDPSPRASAAGSSVLIETNGLVCPFSFWPRGKMSPKRHRRTLPARWGL